MGENILDWLEGGGGGGWGLDLQDPPLYPPLKAIHMERGVGSNDTAIKL